MRTIVSHGSFKKSEIADICVRHLEVDGGPTTRDLAERVLIERRLDTTDATLRNSVVFKLVPPLPCRSAQACPDGGEAQRHVYLGTR
jgi:hypothetical protein